MTETRLLDELDRRILDHLAQARVLRERAYQAQSEKQPMRETIAAAVRTLSEEGCTAAELQALIDDLFIMPVFTILFLNLFDTIGTLIGVGEQAGLVKNGRLPRRPAGSTGGQAYTPCRDGQPNQLLCTGPNAGGGLGDPCTSGPQAARARQHRASVAAPPMRCTRRCGVRRALDDGEGTAGVMVSGRWCSPIVGLNTGPAFAAFLIATYTYPTGARALKISKSLFKIF